MLQRYESQNPAPTDFNIPTLGQVLQHYADKKAFLCWRSFDDDGSGKFNKIPIDPETGLPTRPNTAKARGVMTLQEAADAAAKLAKDGIDVGVGLYAPNAGLTALDLDNCVGVDGTIADWTKPMIGDGTNYVEKSPSGTGLRMLVSQVSPTLDARSNGLERHGVGAYGSRTSKFVTLTGNSFHDPVGQIVPIDPKAEAAIWQYWMKQDEKRGPVSNSQLAGLYPSGRRGMEAALDDVITATSLHPATINFVSRAIEFMSKDEIEDSLYLAYQEAKAVIWAMPAGTKSEGEAKRTQQDRWNKRHPKSIIGALEWIDTRPRSENKLREMPKQRLEGGLRFMRDFLASDRPPAPPKEPENTAGDLKAYIDFQKEKGLKCVFVPNKLSAADELVAVRELGSLNYNTGDHLPDSSIGVEEYERLIVEVPGPLSQYGMTEIDEFRVEIMLLRGEDVPARLQKTGVYDQHLQDEHLATLNEFRNPEQVEVPNWVIDEAPSKIVQDMARHVVDVQKYEMPLLAIMASLVAVSTAAQNSFVVKYLRFNTPLNLYAILIAPSGSGKEAGRGLVKEVGAMVGPQCVSGKVASDAALYDQLVAAGRQGKVLLWDEIWSLFEKLGGPQAPHEQGLLALLLEIYTQGTGQVSPTALSKSSRVDRPDVIYAPAVSFMGSTTKLRLIGSMTESFLSDGLVGRTIFAMSAKGPIKPLGYTTDSELPEDLYGAMKGAVGAFRAVSHAFGTGELPRSLRRQVRNAGSTDAGRGFIDIKMSADQQRRVDQWTRDIGKDFVEDSSIWVAVDRAVSEQTIKIAGLLAVGQVIDTATVMDMSPIKVLKEFGISIDDASLTYAMKLMKHLVTELGTLAGQFEGDSSRDGKMYREMQNKIMDAFKDPDHAPKIRKGSLQREALQVGWIARAHVSQLLGGDPKVREKVIANMIEAEILEAETDLPADLQTKGKNQAKGWRLVGI